MIEILREPPHSPWILLLFFIQILIYLFSYKNDPKRLAYFFSSILDKKYQINYGRHSKFPEKFILTLSLQPLLTGSVIASNYLVYCTNYSNFSNLFFFSFFVLSIFFFVKFTIIIALGILFEKRRLCEEFLSLSIQYTSIFLTPIVLIFPYFYLSKNIKMGDLIFLITTFFLLYLLSKVKLLTQIRNIFSLGMYYYILYICTLELVPLYWLINSLDC